MNIAAGYCDSWAGVMVTRMICGLVSGSVMSIGAATICDLYFTHQRGVYMGIYTVCMTNGACVRSSYSLNYFRLTLSARLHRF